MKKSSEKYVFENVIQGEISLTTIVRREQNHLPQKFGPVHENTGAAATKHR